MIDLVGTGCTLSLLVKKAFKHRKQCFGYGLAERVSGLCYGRFVHVARCECKVAALLDDDRTSALNSQSRCGLQSILLRWLLRQSLRPSLPYRWIKKLARCVRRTRQLLICVTRIFAYRSCCCGLVTLTSSRRQKRSMQAPIVQGQRRAAGMPFYICSPAKQEPRHLPYWILAEPVAF